MRIAKFLVFLYSFSFLASFTAAADHLLFQVEDFEGDWRKQTNISGYLGTGFCTSNANPELAKTVMKTSASLEQSGVHEVWVRAYTSENSPRALQVVINDTPLAVTHSSSERRWSWEKAGKVDLKAGTVQVAVRDAAKGFESADAILITDKLGLKAIELDREAGSWRVFPAKKAPPITNALRFNIDACAAELAKHTPPASVAEWEGQREGLREHLQRALGLLPFPEKTPLNAKVVGRAERADYTIENIVFESRPGFLVTANLYIPKKLTAPGAAVLVTAGHAMETGKNCPTYQLAQLGFVKQGLIVFAIDPIGQGERRIDGFQHELGFASFLVGQTNEGYILWDAIRAVDYLLTRPEIDGDRLGIAGNSGGGENTFYTFPLEPRLAVAGSFSFVCNYDRWVRFGGNHCVCNHMPGLFQHLEEFQIIGLNAPRPFLAGNGVKDSIFPIAGARETIKQAKAIYAFSGDEDKVAIATANEPHGWSKPLREAGYGWFNLHLLGKGAGEPVPESEDHAAEDEKHPDLFCFDSGFIPEESKTMAGINQDRAAAFRQAYATPPQDLSAWQKKASELRSAFWERLGGEPAPLAPSARIIDDFQWEEMSVEALSVATEAGLEIPAFFVLPKTDATKPERPALLYLHPSDKASFRQNQQILEHLKDGGAVLAADLRGMGEVAAKDNHISSDAVCLGRPIFGQRVWDVMQLTRYLASRSEIDPKAISIHGEGPCGMTAIFAAALGAPVASVACNKTLAGFRFYIHEKEIPGCRWLGVPHLLKTGDLDQAAALMAPIPLRLTTPTGYGNAPLKADAAKEAFAYTQSVYHLLDASESFQVLE